MSDLIFIAILLSSNLIFFFIGYWAGAGTLQKKLEIIKKIREAPKLGAVKPLSTQEREKEISKEFRTKYGL